MELRMYLNGSLGQSAVMTYANDVSTSSFLSLNHDGFFYISCKCF